MFPVPFPVYLRDNLMAWDGEKTWPRPEWETGPAVYALASPKYGGHSMILTCCHPVTCDSRQGVEDHHLVTFQSANTQGHSFCLQGGNSLPPILALFIGSLLHSGVSSPTEGSFSVCVCVCMVRIREEFTGFVC